MIFDWYSSTLPAEADEVLPALAGAGELLSVYPARGLHSYLRGAEVRRGGRVFARAWWGGVNGNDVHVQASGPDTPPVVAVLRERWPQHRVSRADAREDWSHPKAWRWVSKIGLSVAERYGLKVSTVGDWVRAKDGRTLYLGGKASRVQVRIYEKGKQLGVDPNWVRLEVQIRPTGDGKAALCAALPGQLLQATPWTRAIAQAIGAPELMGVRIRDAWVPSDDERVLQHCANQYGRVLSARAEQLGGWAQLGELLGSMVEAASKPKH